MGHHHEHGHSEHHHGCSCGHSHEHHKARIPLLYRIILGVLLGLAGFLFQKAEFYLFLLAYLVLGYDILIVAAKNIIKLKPLDENFLMTVAAVGAFCLGEHFEAAAIMLFYQVGEFLSDNAVEKTKSSISALLDVRPDTARIITEKGEKIVPCESIKIGDIVTVGAGERIAVDGKIVKGLAMLDTSSLTGESILREATVGDRALAGMISTDGSLEILCEKEFEDSTLSRILRLAEEEHSKKSNAERFITSFAKVYTPIVVILAVLVAVLPPLFGLGAFTEWIRRAISFLVISCPCALVVSVPLTFFAAMGAFSKSGVLIKNSVTIENLTKIKYACFDKTGTLTKGIPTLTEIRVKGSKAELLELAAYAECDSAHPLATAIKSAYNKPIERSRITSLTELTARGVKAEIDGITVLVGGKRLMEENGVAIPNSIPPSSILVSKNGGFMGYIGFGDSLREDARRVVSALSAKNIKSVILSGDSNTAVKDVAEKVGITDFASELLPNEKAEYIKSLAQNGKVIFIGDGINDLPSIASASVGVAMGGIGSDAAIESADMVIMGDELLRLPHSLKLARYAIFIAKENIILSIGIKFGVLIISSFGIGGLMPAIFADVGLCVLTVLNALRAYYHKFK